MASLQRHAPPWAQTTIGILMATLWACAPPPEHELVPTLGSGPPVADTGDSPADDPDADDPDADDADADDPDPDGDAPEDDTTSSAGGSESGDETRGTSESGEPCPPADEGCACTLDGRCRAGLSCVDGVCEPCDPCEPPRDPCAPAGESDTDACEAEDPCAAGMYGDGPYCGESIGGTAETLYLCAGGATTATSACDFGCAQCDPFEADVCKSFAGQQDAAACE
jgi:hypothetical protein